MGRPKGSKNKPKSPKLISRPDIEPEPASLITYPGQEDNISGNLQSNEKQYNDEEGEYNENQEEQYIPKPYIDIVKSFIPGDEFKDEPVPDGDYYLLKDGTPSTIIDGYAFFPTYSFSPSKTTLAYAETVKKRCEKIWPKWKFEIRRIDDLKKHDDMAEKSDRNLLTNTDEDTLTEKKQRDDIWLL